MSARTFTPDRINAAGGRTITMKRCCNGCGQLLGDVDNRDVDEHGNLTDVRGECDHCRPLVEAEATGCRTWELIPRNFSRIADEIDRLRPWVFTKGYRKYIDDKLQVVGLRIGEYPDHIVAYFGDWIIRHPDGSFTVHKAPEVAS
jgi:hypothetical protein